MKGKINRDGVLELWRVYQFRVMECKRSGMAVVDLGRSPVIASCGDDCALFGEPNPWSETRNIELEICEGRILSFDEFSDER